MGLDISFHIGLVPRKRRFNVDALHHEVYKSASFSSPFKGLERGFFWTARRMDSTILSRELPAREIRDGARDPFVDELRMNMAATSAPVYVVV